MERRSPMLVNLLLVSPLLVSVSFSTPFPWSFLLWDYWVTVGEASEELMYISGGEAGGKASESYFSTQSLDLVYHTHLWCFQCYPILETRMGRGNLEALNQTHTWNMTPFPLPVHPCAEFMGFVSRWECLAEIMPLVLADSGVQIKLENGYHLLPQSCQAALPSKPIRYFLLASAYHGFSCSFCN